VQQGPDDELRAGARASVRPSVPRIAAVDSMRVLAILSVIAIHVAPFTHGAPPARIGLSWNLPTIVNQLARFAVPCFFVLSGYFWAQRTTDPTRRWPVTQDMLRRLGMLFVGWSLIYTLPWDSGRLLRDWPASYGDILARNLRWILLHKLLVLLQGTETHLWFLVALAFAVSISALWLKWGSWRSLLLFGLLLFALAMLMRPYVKLPIGIPVRFNPRNGPAFALLPFALGIALAWRAPSPTLSPQSWQRWGAGLWAAGIALSAAELTWLRVSYGRGLAQDAVFSTMLCGLGAACLALGNPVWLATSRLSRLGPLVLGIYAVHPLIIDMLLPQLPVPRGVLVELFALAMVFVLSWFASALLAAGRWTRFLVR
jgi:surface polysaccharide O-acyltransferase-like enzyme